MNLSNSKNLRLKGLLSTLTLFAAAVPPTLQATESHTLPTITVTAVRSERDIFDIPEAASVVQRPMIERQQPVNLGDLLEDLPNVAVGGRPRGQGQTLTIRGLGDERIVFVMDGARQNFSRAHQSRVFIEPDLLNRVEVLRGPASAIWGSGALGGVVAMETVDAADLLAPGRTLGARVRAGYQDGSDQWLTNAGLYGVSEDGAFDYLLDVAWRDAGDVRLGDGKDLANSGFERLSGLAKASWLPDAYNRLSVSFVGFRQDGEVPSNPQTAGTPDDLVDNDTRQRNLIFSWRHDDPDYRWLRPSLTVYHNEIDMEERRKVDGRKDETRYTTLGADLRNQMRFGGPDIAHTLSYGIEGYRDDIEARRNGQARSSFPDGRTEVLGIYLQDEMVFGGRVFLTPGLRWDRFKSEAAAEGVADNANSELSLKFGLDVSLTDWLSVQALYNEAFRAPGVSELFLSGTHFTCGRGCANLFVPNPQLKPEKAHNKEIGFRLRHGDLLSAGDEARFQARYFRNDVSDFIDQIVNFTFRPVPGNPGRGGISTFRNVRDARLDGFEVQADYNASRWFAGIAYSQTRGEDKETGAALSSVQPDAWFLRAGFRFPAQDLTLGWEANLVDAQRRVPAGSEPSEAYQVHDLWLTWTPGGVRAGPRVELGIDNLFDADYRPYLSVLRAPGRNIKATLAWRF